MLWSWLSFLILLWNTALQPQREVHRILQEVFRLSAPSLATFEEQSTQEANLKRIAQGAMDSGRFTNLFGEHSVCEATYSAEDYLTLLGTYSPYIELDRQTRDTLFKSLKETIDRRFAGSLPLWYLSALQVMRKPG